ncbi:SGNH/GDSL hydrolase family protein [Neobacillus drentensis]|uniref:SGNH/GDSL hydrolase family protein n=1 Tax=Neobacillus drentensis TaxID=220684 RepID=UPI00300224CF
MKSLLTIILAISCGVMLIGGNIYWDKKISAYAQKPIEKTESTKKIEKKEPEQKSIKVEESKNDVLISYTKNWPTQASGMFSKHLAAHEPFQFLIIGSNAIGTSSHGWAYSLETKLIETYGQDNFQVSIKPFDNTSTKFINDKKHTELTAQRADIVLFEPFTLNDNGNIPTKNSLANITTFTEEYKKKNPQSTFILIPPHPIYNAIYYPKQVADLAKYAEENKIPFLNHWTVWPSSSSKSIKDYLLPDQSAPNEKGAQLISDYLAKYFIAR